MIATLAVANASSTVMAIGAATALPIEATPSRLKINCLISFMVFSWLWLRLGTYMQVPCQEM
ncbi:hypothetical protein LP420_10355 [Massilia sp. B-10]|nr:hypothetical protein LP420_10355 [Massilia sp. B-10]